MPDTMTLISAQNVGAGGAASVTFSSIPQTYTDLLIFGSAKNTSGADADWLAIAFNGSTSNFTSKYLEGNGSGVGSSSLARLSGASNGAANIASNYQTYIFNYTTSAYKAYSFEYGTESNATLGYTVTGNGLWSNTAAITSITLTCGNGSNNFAQYSNFYLYGIKNS